MTAPGEVIPRPHVPSGFVTSGELLERVPGLTHRMLDYWSRLGWLQAVNPSPGYGCTRVFPVAEARIAALMVRWTAAGIRPGDASRAARNGGVLAPGVRLVIDEAAA